jgi:hypothetical protein
VYDQIRQLQISKAIKGVVKQQGRHSTNLLTSKFHAGAFMKSIKKIVADEEKLRLLKNCVFEAEVVVVCFILLFKYSFPRVERKKEKTIKERNKKKIF